MRKGLVIIGVILLIVGVLAAGLTYQQTTDLGTIPQAGANGGADIVTLGAVTAGTATVSWSGGASNTAVKIFPCSNSVCSSLGNSVATGTGASGSVSFSATGGATYAIQTNSGGVTGSFVVDGFVPFTFVGIALAGIGAFLLVVGAMARARVRPAPSAVAEPMPAEESSEGMGGPAVGAAPAGDEGTIMPPPSAAAAPTTTDPSKMTKCASCGTLNEIWLHNCRWCKRPLSTTG